jgi:hypothetical protein
MGRIAGLPTVVTQPFGVAINRLSGPKIHVGPGASPHFPASAQKPIAWWPLTCCHLFGCGRWVAALGGYGLAVLPPGSGHTVARKSGGTATCGGRSMRERRSDCACQDCPRGRCPLPECFFFRPNQTPQSPIGWRRLLGGPRPRGEISPWTFFAGNRKIFCPAPGGPKGTTGLLALEGSFRGSGGGPRTNAPGPLGTGRGVRFSEGGFCTMTNLTPVPEDGPLLRAVVGRFPPRTGRAPI